MKLRIVVELSERDAKKVAANSLERVLNMAHRVAEAMVHRVGVAIAKEEAPILLDDLEDLKSIAGQIWYCASSAILAGDWVKEGES